MITVVVDTTATFIDVMLKSTRWVQLLTLCHGSKVSLVVPDVVLRETARHWATEAQQAIKIANGRISGIEKSRDRLLDLGLDGSALVDSTPITVVPDEEEFLAEQYDKLTALGVEVKSVPNHVDIETILQRDLDSKKPFDKSGKGFRDTLVWETVKEAASVLEVYDEIFFVTENSSDYCDDSGQLASELLEELDANAAAVTRVANLEDLLNLPGFAPLVSTLAKTDEQLALFLSQVATAADPWHEPPSVGEVVKNAVLHAIEQLAGEEVETSNDMTAGLNFTELNFPSELQDVSIDVVEPDESTLNWQTYETYQDTTFLIQAEIDSEIYVEAFAQKSDAVHLSENDAIAILEWDWNDHMSRVSTKTAGRLIFQVRVEQGMDVADDCEFEGAEPVALVDPHF